MSKQHKIAMLGSGFIGAFYLQSLQQHRRKDTVELVYSRTPQHARQFAQDWNIPRWTSDLQEATGDPDVDVVIVGLPNYLHGNAVTAAARAGKNVLCTKPLGRTAAEAKEILEICEQEGVFHGYLEDLVYTPKTLKALELVQAGALGDIMWVRSRETHPGPHSAWFWDKELAGGGAIIDMGCHCIEIIRSFIGKDIRPVEVMCWTDTMVHPIEAEDHGIGLIRFDNGALGQFEVSWAFRGGMDLRDEVSGTEGTIWLNHFLRTGFEVFTAARDGGYVAEKAEAESGWLFPVGDEVHELGYSDMFTDMFNALDDDSAPREDFYDGYVVNAVMDACYRSAESCQWEPVQLAEWRGQTSPPRIEVPTEMVDSEHILIKQERLPDGRVKVIMKNKETGKIKQVFR